ncbi:hypothetical protein PO81_08290, partial [Vibrio parahaemolyticus]
VTVDTGSTTGELSDIMQNERYTRYPVIDGDKDHVIGVLNLKEILSAEIPFHSICFKDASGTSNPNKIYETIKMARKILPQDTH